MANNTTLSICICLLFSGIANGQSNEFSKPKVERIVYNKQDMKYGIRYYLPTNPAQLLDSIISFEEKKYGETDYLINLEITGDTISILGYVIHSRIRHLKKKDPIRLISKATHRYILSNKHKIPLYFDTDSALGFFNVAFTDYNFYMRFIGSKYQGGTIIERDY